MAQRRSYREHPSWQAAMDLAEQVYRLSAQITTPEGRRLAGHLAEAAAGLPGKVAQALLQPDSAAPASEELLLRTETLLLLAVRLGHLQEAQVSPALALVERLSAAPGDAETIPAPPPVAAPAPARTATAPRAPEPPALVDHLVVDGCNFLGRAPEYHLGDAESRDRLLFRLQEYARLHPAHRITLFFDGQRASRRKTAGVDERVTSGQRPADDVMVDFLHALPAQDRRRSTIVTDDRELARRAQMEGVRVESVAWLAERLQRKEPVASDAHRQRGLNRGEVESWEDFFNQPPKRPGK